MQVTTQLAFADDSSDIASEKGTSTLQSKYCPKGFSTKINAANIEFKKVLEIDPLTPEFGILEGPVWVDGGLMMSNIGVAVDTNPNPADLVLLKGGQFSVVKQAYGGNGMTFDAAGNVIIARHLDGTITNLTTGQILASSYNGARFNSPNDVVVSSLGDIYFTDPDWQAPAVRPQAAERVYHVDKAGVVTPFGSVITKPNGVMLSLDEKTLYVGGTNGLYKFAVNEDGSVVDAVNPVVIIKSGVDGMSKDCAGNLYVTTDDKVLILSTKREVLIGGYSVPGVTNVAFGGKDGKTLFATTLGARPQVFSAKVTIPGFPF